MTDDPRPTPPQPADHAAFLATRRSAAPAQLGTPAPDGEQLDTILQLAARTPDHGRLVPYRFVVLDHDACVALARVVRDAFAHDNPDAPPEALAKAADRFANAPMVVGVVSRTQPDHPKIPEWEQVLTAGAVCMNLLHAAHALGFGAVWLSGWTAYDRRVLDAAGLSPGERLAGWVHLGTQPEAREERERPALRDIVTRWSPPEPPVVEFPARAHDKAAPGDPTRP